VPDRRVLWMKRRPEVAGQLELPLFDTDEDQGEEVEWVTADSNGSGPVIRWRQVE
jgi:hypothetical protein